MWASVEYAVNRVRAAIASRAFGRKSSSAAMSGPAPHTWQTLSDSGPTLSTLRARREALILSINKARRHHKATCFLERRLKTTVAEIIRREL
jgi:hypothetical protein